MLKDQLEILGLSANEIKLYLYLLENGKGTIQELMRKPGLNVTRQTIYNIIKQLDDKGLIAFSYYKKHRYIEVSPIGNMELHIQRKQEEVDEKKSQIRSLISELKLHKGVKIKHRAEIEIYEGEDEVKKSLEIISSEALENSTIKTIFSPDEDKNKQSMAGFRKKRIKKNICVKGLMSADSDIPLEELKSYYCNKKSLIETRFLPKDKFLFNSEISIFDNVVSISNFKSKPMVSLIIKDNEIKKTIESLFDIAWEHSNMLTSHFGAKNISSDDK